MLIVLEVTHIKRVSTEQHWKKITEREEKINQLKTFRTKLKKDQNRGRYEEGESFGLDTPTTETKKQHFYKHVQLIYPLSLPAKKLVHSAQGTP